MINFVVVCYHDFLIEFSSSFSIFVKYDLYVTFFKLSVSIWLENGYMIFPVLISNLFLYLIRITDFWFEKMVSYIYMLILFQGIFENMIIFSIPCMYVFRF